MGLSRWNYLERAMERGGNVKKKFRPLLVLMNANSSTGGLSRDSEYRVLKSTSFVGFLTFLSGYFLVSVEVGTCYGSQCQQIQNNAQL